MTSIDIHDLLRSGERVTLECKRAKNAVPNSIWETYSAFANTYGGIVLLGVEENLAEKDPAKRFAVVGVEDAEKIRKDLWNMLNNQEKVNVNLLQDGDIGTVPVDGKDIVYIRVPAASYLLRPIYINNNPIRGTYRRNHEGDYHMTEHGVRMMMRDANEDGNDRMLLEYYTIDDIDKPTLERYRVIFNTDHPDHPWKNYSDIDFLKELGGYVVNRREGTEGLTMAGLLMFGKGLPIRERFGNLRMDYIDKTDLVGEQRYSDRITYDGTWENNLFNFIRMVMPRLTRELPRPFQMEGIIRKDDTPQHKAVREAVTNSIIHADLMLNGLLRIVKYDDRYEITNPGLLKLPVEQIYAGDETKARNQCIQVMLRMIGYGENIGSGFPLILQAWEQKRWMRPELIEQPELMQTKLILRHIPTKQNVIKDVIKENSELQQDDINNGAQVVIKDDENVIKDAIKTLSERQKEIIKILATDPDSTTEAVARRLFVTWRTIMRDMKKLQVLGLLKREGGRSDGRWIVIKG